MRHYLDLLNRVFSTDVKPQLQHVERSVDLFAGACSITSLMEKGHLLSVTKVGVRRLKKSIDKSSVAQSRSLLIKADFDAQEVKGNLDAAVAKLSSYLSNLSDEGEEPDWEEILDKDDRERLLSTDEQSDAAKDVRKHLIRNLLSNYRKIRDEAGRADIALDGLIELQYGIQNDASKREAIWQAMHKRYLKEEWPTMEATLKNRIQEERDDPDNGGMAEEQVLQRVLRLLKKDHEENIYKRELRELNSTVGRLDSEAVDVVMKYRDRLQENDLSDYYCYFYSCLFVQKKLQELELRSESDYPLLFCNKAAQEYVESFVPLLKDYGGINNKGHYGVLKLVMQEMGLVDGTKNNGLDMMNWVNSKMIQQQEDRIPEQSSITKVTGKLNGLCFGCIETIGFSRTNIKDHKEYERMKEVYWRCYTILNLCDLIDAEDAGFDAYLREPHAIRSDCDLWSTLTEETRNRLMFLVSVLKGED